jgi:hypothetical protein
MGMGRMTRSFERLDRFSSDAERRRALHFEDGALSFNVGRRIRIVNVRAFEMPLSYMRSLPLSGQPNLINLNIFVGLKLGYVGLNT